MNRTEAFKAALLAFAVTMLAGAGVATAAITPTDDADSLAEALEDDEVVTGAAFQVAPPNGNPAAVADTDLALFPLDGPNYTMLSTGNTREADDPDNSESTSSDNGGDNSEAGPGVRDQVTLRVDIEVPESANCLTFDYRFLTEEFDEFVGSDFNDAFLAELDASTFTLQSDGTVIAPNNFAAGPDGDVTTVNSVGTSADNALGTTYDGATPIQRATTPISPGGHSIFLTVYDASDAIFDSTAFIDNLEVRNVDSDVCVRGSAETPSEDQLCQGQQPTIFTINGVAKGTRDDDVILGSNRSDVIRARGGDDVVCARGGPDLIRGQGGADSIEGNRGRDDLRGNGGNDVILGNRGRDVVSGQAGEDFVKGAKANDRVYGGRADDRLVGNRGDDRIYGRAGEDLLRGGKNSDNLFGGRGDDRCFGGEGSDRRKSC